MSGTGWLRTRRVEALWVLFAALNLVAMWLTLLIVIRLKCKPAYAECSRKTLTNCPATTCSSPGCSMNELIAKPGRPSPAPITMDGCPPRKICEACGDVKEIFASHVICMWGT